MYLGSGGFRTIQGVQHREHGLVRMGWQVPEHRSGDIGPRSRSFSRRYPQWNSRNRRASSRGFLRHLTEHPEARQSLESSGFCLLLILKERNHLTPAIENSLKILFGFLVFFWLNFFLLKCTIFRGHVESLGTWLSVLSSMLFCVIGGFVFVPFASFHSALLLVIGMMLFAAIIGFIQQDR
jgi:hypothetical protein